ncbi:uncharacterized protein LOC141691218 [Apium graveolens]|uniref:uncharacterized protein LOC141691218 n=1 Tax=Apium graveolens TaxID=4045 RepID=UPI003D7A6B8C
MYYVSKRLIDGEKRYTNMENLVYALLLAARKLRPYFQAHKVEVRTAYPLQQVIYKPEASGRMLKWAIELRQFDLEYKPRSAIKGQALANFMLEFRPEDFDGQKALVAVDPNNEEHLDKEHIHESWWILHIDGVVNSNGARAGVVLESPEGHQLMSVINFARKGTKSDAKYETFISSLKLALVTNIVNLIIQSDYMLVVHQVNGGFQSRGPRTKMYLRYLQSLIRKFGEVRVEKIPREENSNDDTFTKWGSQKKATFLGVIHLEIQEKPSILFVKVMEVDSLPEETWMTPIWEYLKNGTLPKDRMEVRRLR